VVSWMERRALPLVIVLSAAVLAAVRWFAPGIDTATISGRLPVLVPPPTPIFLVAACTVAAIALVLAALFSKSSRRYIPQLYLLPMVFTSLATVGGLLVSDHWIRLGLLELGVLLTVALVWFSARTFTAKMTYLAVVLISALSLFSSDRLMDSQSQWAHTLLLTSILVKLAALPLFFWLLSLADELPNVVLGLVIAVVDMAAFAEFWIAAQSIPGLFSNQALLLCVAAATSFIAALLMLTQRSLKRLLVLSTIEDAGFLLLGVFSLNVLGFNGAIIAASTHALAKALLFICLSGPEADGALEGDPKGLATRYPVAAFGFLFGMLAMLGIPPTMGFIGRWRLYETALQISPVLLAVFVLSSILALIAYVLALTKVWWGPACEPNPRHTPPHPTAELSGANSIQVAIPVSSREPLVLQGVIVALVALLLAGGIWPDALQLLLGGRP